MKMKNYLILSALAALPVAAPAQQAEPDSLPAQELYEIVEDSKSKCKTLR